MWCAGVSMPNSPKDVVYLSTTPDLPPIRVQRSRPVPIRDADAAWLAARDLVMRYGWNAVAYQILNPGMRLWFSSAGDAVAGYVSFGRVMIIAGAPVCRRERLPDVALELEAGRARPRRAGGVLRCRCAARAGLCGTPRPLAGAHWRPARLGAASVAGDR
jgi:hypothetical protein